MGALKWGLPAVTAVWLLACAEEGRRVSEKTFLVGETKGMYAYYVRWGMMVGFIPFGNLF